MRNVDFITGTPADTHDAVSFVASKRKERIKLRDAGLTVAEVEPQQQQQQQ